MAIVAAVESAVDDAVDDAVIEAAQRRTLPVLFASAIFARGGFTLMFAVAVLLIEDMLGSSRWAGLSTVAITVGTVISASALSAYMNRRGRRPGLALGYAVAFGGGIIATFGAQVSNIAAFLVGLVLVGVGAGASNLARYAAADLAAPKAKSKAISLVVFASTVGAVGGPSIVGLADDIGAGLGLNKNVGPNAATAVFLGIAAVIVFVWLRPDPLVVINGLQPSGSRRRGDFARSLRTMWANPMARLALTALDIAQAVMVGVMAMTPLHMRAHDHDVSVIGFVIGAHTAGMYAFAPIAGWASDRFGRVRSISFGGAVLVVATIVTALAGEAPKILMFPGLYLLGLGWSVAVVAGSALLSESVPIQEKVSIQGAADLVAAAVSGIAALASGFILDMAGFHVLSIVGTLAAGALLLAGFSQDRVLSLTSR